MDGKKKDGLAVMIGFGKPKRSSEDEEPESAESESESESEDVDEETKVAAGEELIDAVKSGDAIAVYDAVAAICSICGY